MQTRGQKFDPLAFQVLMDPGPAWRTDLTQPCFGGGVRSGERGSAPSPSLWGPDRGSLVSFQTTALVQGMAASDCQACSASGGQRHTLSLTLSALIVHATQRPWHFLTTHSPLPAVIVPPRVAWAPIQNNLNKMLLQSGILSFDECF